MQIKLLSLATILLLICTSLPAQQKIVSIKGRVFNEFGQPVSDVYVSLDSCDIHALSDANGFFLLQTKPWKNCSVHFKHIAYHKRVIGPLNFSSTKQVKLDSVTLSAKIHSTEAAIITASRADQTITQIALPFNYVPRMDIIARNAKTSAEVLREETGLFIQKTNHGGGSAIIRGLSSNRILLLIDGVRLNNAAYRLGNHQYLTTVDNNSLERIEVLRGPASALYGSDALGGTVNLLTTKPFFSENSDFFSINGFTRIASADHEKTIHSDFIFSSQKFFFQSSISFKDFSDLRRGANSSHPELELSTKGLYQSPTGFSGWDFHSKLAYSLSKEQIIALVLQHSAQEDVPRYDKYENNHYYKWLYTPQNRNLAYLYYENSSFLPYMNNLKITLSMQHQEEGRQIQKSMIQNLKKEQDNVNSYGLSVQTASHFANHQINAGLDFYHDFVNSSRRIFNTNEVFLYKDRFARFPDASTYNRFGLYLQDEIELTNKITLRAGGRYSYQKAKFTIPVDSSSGILKGNYMPSFQSFVGNLGVSFKIDEGLSINGNISQGFRAPNLSDFAKLGSSKGSVYEVPNPALAPEKIINFEFGLKYTKQKFRARLNIFYSILNDLIESAPTTYADKPEISIDSVTYKIKSKQNIGNGFISGGEISALIKFTESISLNSNLTYIYGQNQSSAEPIGGIPPLFGMVGLLKNFQKSRIEGYMRFALAQKRLSDDDRDDPRIPSNGTPGWFTMNLRGKYEVNSWFSVQAAIENILDLNYREHGSGINGAGRNFILSLHFRN